MGTTFQDSLLKDTHLQFEVLCHHMQMVFVSHITLKQNSILFTTREESCSIKSIILNIHLGISYARWI